MVLKTQTKIDLQQVWIVFFLNLTMKNNLLTVKHHNWNILNMLWIPFTALVISFVGFHYKFLRMSWYLCTKLFWINLNLVISCSPYLTGLRLSVACSNIMGGFVPSLISVHIAVRLRRYIIFRNTSHLFPLHLKLVRPPPFVPKPYALMFSPAHDCQRSWLPPFHHLNVKNRPCNNVMGHTVVSEGDVLPNCPHPPALQGLTNVVVIPLPFLSLRHPSKNPLN